MSGKKIVELLLKPLGWFYPTAKATHMWRLRYVYSRFKNGPVLVLQMGKVGSRSVQAGLVARVHDRPIYHSHFLSPERVVETEDMRRKYFRTDRYSSLKRQWLSQFLLRSFEKHIDDHKWKLITLTREPIGRNISAFFENLDVVPSGNEGEFEIRSDYYKIAPTTVSIGDTSRLSELFFERARHDSPVRFFNREIKDIFDIDVFEDEFPTDRGYRIYSNDRVDLLVIRLEDLSECVGSAFEDFLELRDFELVNTNIAAKKVYAPLYEAFKKNVVIGPAYADQLYNSHYMRTFYNDVEIERARRKWLKNSHSLAT